MIMELRTDDGLRLNYQVVGHGQSLVFIHGFGGYHQVWTRQVEYFTSHGYQVVTYDQRNHGTSQFDPNLDSIHRLSRDLQELLALPTINHPILIGHSMGASVIYDFLTRYPNYPLAGVVAVDQSPRLINSPSWPYGFMKVTRANYQQGLLAPGVSETLHGIDQHVYDQLRVVKQQFPFGRAANRELVTDVARQDFRPTLATTKVPTLLVTANQSPFYQSAYATVAKYNPMVHHVSINQSGHVVMAEQVAVFNQVVSQFLHQL